MPGTSHSPPPRKPQLHNSISNPPVISKLIPQQQSRAKSVPHLPAQAKPPRPAAPNHPARADDGVIFFFFSSFIPTHDGAGGIKLGMRLRHTVAGFVFPRERVCPSGRPRAPDGNERARSPRCLKCKMLRASGFSGWIKGI